MIKRAIVVSLILGLAFTFGLAAHPDVAWADEVVKIGVIDLQKAITSSKKGNEVRARLTKKFGRLQKELSMREAEIKKMKEELERQSAMLSPEAKFEKEKTFKRKVRDFQDQYRDYTQEMKKEEYTNTKPIVDAILIEANKLGKEKGYTLIIERQKAGVIYFPKSLDITDQVVSRYDAAQ